MEHDSQAIVNNYIAPAPPSRDWMPGSTSRATRAQPVLPLEIEETLLQDLHVWRDGSPRDSDTYCIAVQPELVIPLAARLRSAPWAVVLTAAPDSQGRPSSTKSALQLLAYLLSVLHDIDAGVGGSSSAPPKAPVLRSLARQVCAL